MRFVSDNKDLKMASGRKFWLTIQRGYVVLNWRAITGRPMCHHLVLCTVLHKDSLKDLVSQLSELLEA